MTVATRKATTNPNRSRKGQPPSPARNPKPAEITKLREQYGLSESDAALVVHSTYRAWHQWEVGERRMHACFWNHFQVMIGAKPLQVVPRKAAS